MPLVAFALQCMMTVHPCILCASNDRKKIKEEVGRNSQMTAVLADVVTGLLTLLARVVAGSQYRAETRARLAQRFAPVLVQQHTVDFDAVRGTRFA